MKFEVNMTYKLVDPKGFSNSFLGNVEIAKDIMETGGTIKVLQVTNGNATKLLYGDGSTNNWASVMASEIRFFKLDIVLNNRVVYQENIQACTL